MELKEDRPDIYEAEYTFEVNLTGEAAVQVIRALWGLGHRESEDSPIIWGYSGDFTAVYAEGIDAEGQPAHRFFYDFHSQKEVDVLAELTRVEKLIAIASAYETGNPDDSVKVEALQAEGGLESALTKYRPCRNWSKGHWNNILVVRQGNNMTVKVVGIAELKGEQFNNNPYMRGDFHEEKVQTLFAGLIAL